MSSEIESIKKNKTKISVIGLGYVGLPLAVAFSDKVEVVGFDTSKSKIETYKRGIDITEEVGNQKLSESNILFTSNEEELKECSFHIVSVPTPVNSNKIPDLTPVTKASETIGRNLKKGTIVVYESTVYPGVTEDVCIPILEKNSGLIAGIDFKVGYSPERINPGDRTHRLENIVKVVSGMDTDSLEEIAALYELIIKAGVYRAESIKVAEAAKVIENSQRDINIAFMNELAMVFNKMDINTNSVLEAAKTKWNFLDFKPGLVGGHCISVDPYYFIYKAEELGYHSQIILSGRKINDGMGKYVADNLLKLLFKNKKNLNDIKVGIMGIAFKENCPDVRNSKVIDIINELNEYSIKPLIIDPLVSEEEIKREYGLSLATQENFNNLDAIVLAVPHKEFTDLSPQDFVEYYKKNQSGIFIDVKSAYNNKDFENIIYWSL